MTRECVKASLDRLASRRGRDTAPDDEWDQAYHSLNPLLETVARRRRRGLLEPDDATQEAWLALIARFQMDQVVDEGPEFSIWMAIVVRNRLANLERQAARRLQISLDDGETGALMGREEDPADAFERTLVRSAVCEALAEARGRLSEASYLVIVLRWIEERTTPEIAEALGMTTSQVRDRHRRAIPILRQLLGRHFRAGRSELAMAGRALDPLDPGAGEILP